MPAAALLLPVGDDRFAVDLVVVEEVVEPSAVTRLPGAPAVALGVLNVRGRVVPVLDLGRLLGLTPVGGVVAVAVVGTSRGPCGLACDDVPASAVLEEDLGPSDLAGAAERWRVGERGVATRLDVEALLAAERLAA